MNEDYEKFQEDIHIAFNEVLEKHKAGSRDVLRVCSSIICNIMEEARYTAEEANKFLSSLLMVYRLGLEDLSDEEPK